MSVVLSAQNLRKTYTGQAVVDGVSITLNKGECYGLLGPNGAGKTTTLRLLLGLIEPDGGQLNLLGHAVPHDAREARLRVGVVPQVDNLDPDFTVAENLLVYGRYFGMQDSEIASRIPALLEFANLAHKRDVRIPTLSGGMKRRLTLARALVNDPDIVFLDTCEKYSMDAHPFLALVWTLGRWFRVFAWEIYLKIMELTQQGRLHTT